MNDNKKVIVGMGEALWDMLPEGRKLGGAPANFAYHVSQFGLDSCVVSAIGDDPLGREIINNFDDKGLTHIIESVPFSTGTVQVTFDDDHQPQYEIKEGVAWDNIPFTPALADLASRTRAVCFGSLAQRSAASRETINRFLDAMPKDEDTLVVFDVNLRQHFFNREIIENSLRRCNVFKINDEEIEVVAPMLGIEAGSLEEAGRRLLETYGLKYLILTCGERGSYVFTPDKTMFLATPVVQVADPVGAGDSFTAAFIASIIKGDSVESAHRRAVEVSAYVCTQPGAMPSLPTHIVTD